MCLVCLRDLNTEQTNKTDTGTNRDTVLDKDAKYTLIDLTQTCEEVLRERRII